ncbi:hypothetical protein OJ253_3361 [Cryptosporidium canis]|uniref:Uncharacterized protein n=1 Tax=Cryptosporidium canis TaxID=195482 RepID=A0A9D5DJX3_9CRYT|nr:hypothetical protein OJ253_3361 [Cryptosporidium canis]
MAAGANFEDNSNLQISLQGVLSDYSNFPLQYQVRKFKFDVYAKDPVCGSSEDREEYLELLSISKQFESTLLHRVPKGKELAQLIPVELFCAQMQPIFKCLLRKAPSSSTSKDPQNLIFKTAQGNTWLVFKGSHAKVVAGYMTTPSYGYHMDNDFQFIPDKYNQNERKFLHVNKKESLLFDVNSEFYKFFKPRSTPMSNLKVFFHGNGVYSSGWLRDGVTAQIAIKGQVRKNSQKCEIFWNREKEYTLFLSSSEIWKTYQGYINFVPGVFSLYSISSSIKNIPGTSHFKSSFHHKQNIHPPNLISNKSESSQIIPDLKNKDSHFSEFLIMEYSHGMKFNEFKRRLKSISAVYYYNLTDDWQGWFNNSLFLLYMGLSIISTFSTTGRYLYMHCDLHGENIIVQNIPSMTLSRILFTNMQKLIKLENIKIIDHMFVWTPKNVGDRNRSIPCTELQEVSVTDTECLTALLLGPLFRWDYYPFESPPESTENFKLVDMKAQNFFERVMNIPEWRRISSYYVGKAPEWYHQWKRFGSKMTEISINTFNEQFEGIMMVCDYLQSFMAENGVLQQTPCIQFHSYIRGYMIFNYRAMRVGFCIRENLSKILSKFKSSNVGRIPDMRISYWDLSRLSLLFYWNLLASNMKTCLPSYDENEGYVFEFGGGIQVILDEEHCSLVSKCILEENQLFAAKIEKLNKANGAILGYDIHSQEPSKSLKDSYINFMQHIRSQEFKNQKIKSQNRSLHDLTLETISAMDGDLGRGISSKAKNIIETKNAFDYEEFLFDRWIFSLYYQSNLSLSLTLMGLRYSFRVEPSYSGKRGQVNSILRLLKRSALILNLLPSATRDMSESDIMLSCDMFFRTYYEIALEKYMNEKEVCGQMLEEIASDRNYKHFKSNIKFNNYSDEVKSLLFDSNGQQKLMIINPDYICRYNLFNADANTSPNNEIIRQGFCNILLKPLNNINIKIE